MAAFMEKHWDGEPLVLQGRDPGLVEGLMSPRRMDRLIHSVQPHASPIPIGEGRRRGSESGLHRRWGARGTGAVDGFLDREATRGLMAQGCTFVMESVQRSHPEVARLSRLFEQAFHCPSPVNLYLTLPSAPGLPAPLRRPECLRDAAPRHQALDGLRAAHQTPLPSQAVHGAVQPGSACSTSPWLPVTCSICREGTSTWRTRRTPSPPPLGEPPPTRGPTSSNH